MCDQYDGQEQKDSDQSNAIYNRFKKKLVESNYQIKCRKCQQEQAAVLLQKKDAFCPDCLIDHCTKTFRSTMGKSRLIKPNDQILIGFSAGSNSIALVDLIRRGLDENEFQKLRFKPTLLFIDESIIRNDKQLNLTKELYKFMCDMKIDFYLISLQCCLGDLSNNISINSTTKDSYEYEDIHKYFINNNNQSPYSDEFLQYYNNLNDSDLRYDFIQRFRQLCLVKMAYFLNMDKVFIASTMDELSIEFMNNITFGRGIIAPNEINFCDNRYDRLLLLRPLCELSNKEINFYLKFRQLNHLPYRRNNQTKSPIKSTINRINEHFINSLAEDFPSTIHTIFKTGNKIKLKTQSKRCQFCHCSIDDDDDDDQYTSYDALKLTSNISINNNDHIEDDDDNNNNNNNLSSNYCYSCKKLINNQSLFEQFCILKF